MKFAFELDVKFISSPLKYIYLVVCRVCFRYFPTTYRQKTVDVRLMTVLDLCIWEINLRDNKNGKILVKS